MFDGIGPKSIVVVDNCSIHVAEVKKMFEDVGIPVFFHYNPIEEAFSYVKTYLRKHDDILQHLSSPCSVIKSAFDSITSYHCGQWIEHSGYCQYLVNIILYILLTQYKQFSV